MDRVLRDQGLQSPARCLPRLQRRDRRALRQPRHHQRAHPEPLQEEQQPDRRQEQQGQPQEGVEHGEAQGGERRLGLVPLQVCAVRLGHHRSVHRIHRLPRKAEGSILGACHTPPGDHSALREASLRGDRRVTELLMEELRSTAVRKESVLHT